MTTISVPKSVAEALAKAERPVRLVDEQGNLLGSFAPVNRPVSDELTPEELEEIKRRMKNPGPRYTTQQVVDYLNSRAQK